MSYIKKNHFLLYILNQLVKGQWGFPGGEINRSRLVNK